MQKDAFSGHLHAAGYGSFYDVLAMIEGTVSAVQPESRSRHAWHCCPGWDSDLVIV
jgi:hypothetical protein